MFIVYFFSFCLKVLNSFVIWKPQNSIWLLSDFLGCVEVLPRDIVKRWFHFASAVSFATSVLSFLFRSQGMLQSFGGEIGKFIEAPQGKALESISPRGPFQNSVNKHKLHKTTVLGIAGRDVSKDKRLRLHPTARVLHLPWHPRAALSHHCSAHAPLGRFERTCLFIPI